MQAFVERAMPCKYHSTRAIYLMRDFVLSFVDFQDSICVSGFGCAVQLMRPSLHRVLFNFINRPVVLSRPPIMQIGGGWPLITVTASLATVLYTTFRTPAWPDLSAVAYGSTLFRHRLGP